MGWQGQHWVAGVEVLRNSGAVPATDHAKPLHVRPGLRSTSARSPIACPIDYRLRQAHTRPWAAWPYQRAGWRDQIQHNPHGTLNVRLPRSAVLRLAFPTAHDLPVSPWPLTMAGARILPVSIEMDAAVIHEWSLELDGYTMRIASRSDSRQVMSLALAHRAPLGSAAIV